MNYLKLTDLTDYDGTGTITLSINIWYHLAFTYNNTTKVLTGYVNGAIDASVTGGSTLGTVVSGGNMQFGYDINAAGRYFNGKVSDCMIFNTNLSQAQILNLYNNQKLNRKYS